MLCGDDFGSQIGPLISPQSFDRLFAGYKREFFDLVHSYAGPPADMREALDLIAAGEVDVGALVTHRLGLDETARGFDLMVRADRSLKVVIEPQR